MRRNCQASGTRGQTCLREPRHEDPNSHNLALTACTLRLPNPSDKALQKRSCFQDRFPGRKLPADARPPAVRAQGALFVILLGLLIAFDQGPLFEADAGSRG